MKSEHDLENTAGADGASPQFDTEEGETVAAALVEYPAKIGGSKGLEISFTVDPIDAYGVQQLKEIGGNKGLEISFTADPIDALASSI